MALQIWLPLLGNTYNRGCNGANSSNITTNGVTFSDTGKIGKCASFTPNSYIFGANTFVTNSTDDWSYCCWMKLNATTAGQCLFSARTGTTYAGITLFYYGSKWYIDDGARWNFTPTNTIAIDTWYHICVVRSKTKGKFLYVNGVLDSSTTEVGTPTTIPTCFSIGGSQGSPATSVTGNYLNGYLNDVRFYDHALSQREIKEISKGLVVHYPLNPFGAMPNLFKRTPRTNAPTAYLAYSFSLSENLTAGTTYTMQLWDVDVSHTGKTASTLGIGVYWGGGTVNLFTRIGTSYFTNGHADYLSATFTITDSQAGGTGATNLYINIYNSPSSASGTMNMSIGRWKIEKSSVATPWSPNTTDTGYSALAYDSKRICDVSGACKNGTSVNVPTITSDTPRNSVAITFDGTSDKITLTSPFVKDSSYTVKNSQMSFAFWINRNNYEDSTTRYIYWDYCYIYLYSDYKLRISWVHSTAEATEPPTNAWAPGLLIPTNEWHHVCFTYNSGVISVYYDGEFYKSDNRSSTGQFMGVYRTSGNLGAGNNANFLGGSLSDFRIYATALSADDVLALYNTPTSVADNGSMLTQGEFVEQ